MSSKKKTEGEREDKRKGGQEEGRTGKKILQVSKKKWDERKGEICAVRERENKWVREGMSE